MKKYVIHFRPVNRNFFEDIKAGRKTIETRAASPKYSGIEQGSTLVLVCSKDRYEIKVKKVKRFKTIGALLKTYPLKKIMPELKTEKEARAAWYSYPGYREKIKKFGLIAFEL